MGDGGFLVCYMKWKGQCISKNILSNLNSRRLVSVSDLSYDGVPLIKYKLEEILK